MIFLSLQHRQYFVDIGALSAYTRFRMRSGVFRHRDPGQNEAKGGR